MDKNLQNKFSKYHSAVIIFVYTVVPVSVPVQYHYVDLSKICSIIPVPVWDQNEEYGTRAVFLWVYRNCVHLTSGCKTEHRPKTGTGIINKLYGTGKENLCTDTCTRKYRYQLNSLI